MSQRTGNNGAPRRRVTTQIYTDPRDPEAALLRGVDVGYDSHGELRYRVDDGLDDDERLRIAEALLGLAPRVAPGGRAAVH